MGREGVDDPIAFYRKEVKAMNEKPIQEGEKY